MPAFVASTFFSQQNWGQNGSSFGDRFQQGICTVEELPQTVSTLRSGKNIMIRHEGAGTESGEEGYAAYGHFVLWATSAAVDQAWDLLKLEFLQDQLGQAVAIAARKQKPDWYIEEFKRPFGECRLTVSTRHSSNISSQTQAANQIAHLLSKINISNIFYVANTDIDQAKSVPAAARLTQAVYESPSHHLVYVHSAFPAAAQRSRNAIPYSLQNSAWQGDAATRRQNTYSRPGRHPGRGADSERW